MTRTQIHTNRLIADSGATNTDWCLVSQGETLLRFSGNGISPIHQSEENCTRDSGAGFPPSEKAKSGFHLFLWSRLHQREKRAR